MYEIMKSASEEGSVRKERPYSNILVPMMENETELRNELADLKDQYIGYHENSHRISGYEQFRAVHYEK